MSIVNQLKKNLSEFEQSITIVDADDSKTLRFGGSLDEAGAYLFNQKDTIDLIDLYYNSRYKDGKIDKDGQRKLFMNIVQFKANVAEKQTDIDVSNYTFIPDSEKDANLVWFLKRQFTVWARENYYGQIINDLNKDYSKYGTCVLKKVGDTVERVPLVNLMNTQNCKSLKEAPEDGGYVIIKHEMTKEEMKKFPDWDTSDLELEEPVTVYEMYAMYDPEYLGQSGEDKILGVLFMSLELGRDNPVLFAEAIDEVPLEEAHWDKQDGRWLGVGEVEKQFENQVAVNMTENLRRKHLIYGAKKVWQTAGNAVVRNLVKEVQDGAVLEVGPNGAISEVPMASQNLQEFELSKNAWMSNSDQKAFAFEVATGESMPSGTPFRLGVILANSTARYYELKRENFGLFLYRSFFSQLIPIFQKQTKEHNIAVANGEEGTEFIKDAIVNYNANRRINQELINGNVPDIEVIRAEIEQEMNEKPFLFVKVPKGAYKDAKFYMTLDITGEEMDTNAEMATLTTLYQTLAQQGDPRADTILEKIIALTGNNPNRLLSSKENVMSQVQQGVPSPAELGGAGQMPALTGLNQAPGGGADIGNVTA